MNSYFVDFTKSGADQMQISDPSRVTSDNGLTVQVTSDGADSTGVFLVEPQPQSDILTLSLEFDFPNSNLAVYTPPGKGSSTHTGPTAVRRSRPDLKYVPAIEAAENAEEAKAFSDAGKAINTPPQPPLTTTADYYWGVSLVAKDGTVADLESDRRISVVCQFRPDGVHLTMPHDGGIFKSGLLLPLSYDGWNVGGTTFQLDLFIERVVGPGPAAAAGTLRIYVPNPTSQEAPRTVSWQSGAQQFSAFGVDIDEIHIQAVGIQVVSSGSGTVSARLLKFSLNTQLP